MPYNQLLLPLLGGYLLINFTYITSHWTSRQSKEHFLLAAALAGLGSLIIARTTIVLLMQTPLQPVIHEVYLAIHSAAPYDGIGTALAALFLCVFLMFWINWVWPQEDVAIWLYANNVYNPLERMFHYTFLRADQVETKPFLLELLHRMFVLPPLAAVTWVYFLFRAEPPPAPPENDGSGDHEFADIKPISVMLSMKDRKVYVGWIEWVPPLRADTSSYVKIVPAFSGYRDPTTLKIEVTEQYDSSKFTNPKIPKGKIIAIGDIANASLFDEATFQQFGSRSPVTVSGSAQPRPGVLQRLLKALLD